MNAPHEKQLPRGYWKRPVSSWQIPVYGRYYELRPAPERQNDGKKLTERQRPRTGG